MTTLRLLYHLARADFLERARRTSFLFAVALGLFLGYSVNAGQIGISLGDYRGVYNSAWVGSMMALVVNTFLSLAGFYIVKNAVQRDLDTGVGQIMAATPLTRLQYVVGKWLSHLAVLMALVLVLVAAAIVLQLTQREVPEFDLPALLLPMLVLTLPMMALTAAAAVLFETIGWLRGGLGNVIYFFVWSFGLTASIVPPIESASGFPEPVGLSLLYFSMSAAAKAAFPDFSGTEFTLGSAGGDPRLLQTFVWNGLTWTPGIILGQLLWVGVALGLVALAALFFNRFDATRAGSRRTPAAPEPADTPATVPAPTVPAAAAHTLAPVSLGRSRFGAVWLAELRLLLKGQRWWWFVVAAGLIIAGLASPPEVGRQYLLPVAWIWPALIWSQLGNREAAHRTGQLVFAAPRAVWRQLPAAWLAGVALAAVTGSGVLVTLLRTGDTPGLAAWAAGALFVPALALCLGVVSGGSKLFEITYLLIWYIGPLNNTPPLDYTGSTGHSQPLAFLVAALALFIVALGVRQWQVQGR